MSISGERGCCNNLNVNVLACDKQHYSDALGHYVFQTRINKRNQYTHADNENYLQFDNSTSEGMVNKSIEISYKD